MNRAARRAGRALNRGASVAWPGPHEARQLFDARRVIEAVTTARDARAAGDRGRAIRLSGAFHIRIAEIAGQAVLIDAHLDHIEADLDRERQVRTSRPPGGLLGGAWERLGP